MKKILTLVTVLAFAPQLTLAQPTPDGANAPKPCEQRLVSYADWPSLKDPEFSIDLAEASGGRLFYYGARHSTDPTDPQFDEIERAWNATKPNVAFYEGPNRHVPASREEAVKQTGESGFVRYLAARDGVSVVSLEPSPQEESEFVSKQYPADQVELFYVLREAARLRERRGLKGEELKQAVGKMLERVAAMTGGKAAFTTLEGLDAAYRRYWTTPADWREAPQDWFDPLKTSAQTGGKFTNDINRLSSEYRNLHMYAALSKAVLEGKRVFAVVGRNHVPMQAAALRCALK